jgi:hypothetical protein
VSKHGWLEAIIEREGDFIVGKPLMNELSLHQLDIVAVRVDDEHWFR